MTALLANLAFVLVVSGQPPPVRPRLAESFSAEVSELLIPYLACYSRKIVKDILLISVATPDLEWERSLEVTIINDL